MAIWLQATAICRIKNHSLRCDQRMFRVNRSLHVVRRQGVLTHQHEACLWFRVPLQLL